MSEAAGDFAASVSVVMTCYNQERFVEQAIASVLAQSRADFLKEVIVVNDGSTDDTQAVLEKLAAANPVLQIHHTANRGPSAGRNHAIRLAEGRFVAFLDGDDFWREDKLERQMSAFQADPRIGVVYSDYVDFSAADLSDAVAVSVRRYDHALDDTLREYFIHDAPIVTSTAVVRMETLNDVGPFDESFFLGEDTEIFLRIGERWRFQHVDGGLMFKRRHERNLSSALERFLPAAQHITRRFVERNPALNDAVPARMARRFARIGNDCIVAGERLKGARYIWRAIRSDPGYWRSYAYLALLFVSGAWLRRALKRGFNAGRRAAASTARPGA